MKNKVLTLLTLTLLGALLLTGCGDAEPSDGAGTTPVADTTTTATPDSQTENPRPDLVWQESGVHQAVDKAYGVPGSGEVAVWFEPSTEAAADPDKRYAVCFQNYDYLDSDTEYDEQLEGYNRSWAPAIDYLTDLGWEKVDWATYPIFAVTWEQLNQFTDCTAMQTAANMTTDYGISVFLASNQNFADPSAYHLQMSAAAATP